MYIRKKNLLTGLYNLHIANNSANALYFSGGGRGNQKARKQRAQEREQARQASLQRDDELHIKARILSQLPADSIERVIQQKREQELKHFLSHKRMMISSHAIDQHKLEDETTEFLKPLIKHKNTILQVLELNNGKATEFSPPNAKYDYTISVNNKRKDGKLRYDIKITEKETGILRRMILNEEWNSIITVFKQCDRAKMSDQERIAYFKKYTELTEKTTGINIPIHSKKQLTKDAMAMQEYLSTKSIEISWIAAIKACKNKIPSSELIRVLSRPELLKKADNTDNLKIGKLKRNGKIHEVHVTKYGPKTHIENIK
ncbi:MAG: hypothetical protein A2Y25_03690 [Candidatus Melainabacteria bacterium GWF2_37_15]|nr:MAG: hypothetical protein A2Y25_03690 [Candidatus Melainabacteria bacterium GWF2_37_15]